MILPGAISPSKVPRVISGVPPFQVNDLDKLIFDSTFSEFAHRSITAMEAHECIFESVVLYFGAISSSNKSFGTELLISRRVTASPLTQVPIYSLSAP